MPQTMIFIIILFIIIMIFTSTGIKIVPEKTVFVIERYGVYNKTLQPGMYFIIPFMDRVVKVVYLSEKVYQTNEGTFRTFDDKSLSLRIKVSYQVTDPKLYHYGFNKDLYKLQEIAFDNIRNLILQNTTEDIKLELSSIEEKVDEKLTEVTETWGLNILQVHVIL